jgi:DNA-binding IclR family transcriptional regulator
MSKPMLASKVRSHTGNYASPSLERGLMVLGLFSEERPEWRVIDVARELNLPLSSTYRIVQCLSGMQYLTQIDKHRGFRLGPTLIRLGATAFAKLDIRALARPILSQLANAHGETAVLVLPRDGYGMCVEHVEGTYPIRPRSLVVGELVSLTSGAVGVAILAFLEESHRESIIASEIPREADRAKLRRRCESVRASGICHSTGELIVGTAAIAVPVFGPDGLAVVGSIAVTGMESRIQGLDPAVMFAAHELSSELGASTVDPRTLAAHD